MKAQELRIGNYVTIDNPICWLKLQNIPLLVTAVNEKMDKFDLESFPHSDGTVKLKSEYDTYGQFSQFIAPIELTEEWLIKLGFDISDNSYSDLSGEKKSTYQEAFIGDNPITKDYLLILKNTGNGWFYRNGYFKIEYVHDLQNLYFALTKQELIISK